MNDLAPSRFAPKQGEAEATEARPVEVATDPPSGQLPPVDPELFERAREAVSAIRGRGRRANGQAGDGNTLALKTGLRSLQLVEHPDIAAWHQEQVAAISADLGGEAELSALA